MHLFSVVFRLILNLRSLFFFACLCLHPFDWLWTCRTCVFLIVRASCWCLTPFIPRWHNSCLLHLSLFHPCLNIFNMFFPWFCRHHQPSFHHYCDCLLVGLRDSRCTRCCSLRLCWLSFSLVKAAGVHLVRCLSRVLMHPLWLRPLLPVTVNGVLWPRRSVSRSQQWKQSLSSTRSGPSRSQKKSRTSWTPLTSRQRRRGEHLFPPPVVLRLKVEVLIS